METKEPFMSWKLKLIGEKKGTEIKCGSVHGHCCGKDDKEKEIKNKNNSKRSFREFCA